MKINKIFIIIGSVVGLLGLVLFLGTEIYSGPEKPGAYYLFCHWFDVPYEIGLPMIVTGAFVLFIGIIRIRKNNKRIHTDGANATGDA